MLKRSPVLQCKNCQLFFHSAAGCHRKFRCVKCDKDHPPAACPRNSDKSLPVACCNCHQNHSANDLQNCKFFAKHIKPIIDKRVKDRNKAASVNSKFIHEQTQVKPQSTNTKSAIKRNVSFSSVVANNMATKQNTQSTNDKANAQETTGKLSMCDLKNLFHQNMQLMSAHQELMRKLSCLIE